MTVIAFDTLSFSNKLKEAGMNPRIADVQAQETAKILNELSSTQVSQQDVLAVKQEIKEAELRIIKWMIGMVVGQTAFLLSMLHFLQ